MFNPEKMLGNLLMGGVRRKRGLGGLLSGGAALGLVGVAMEAAEHFMKTQGQTAGSPPAPPGQTPSSRPPSPAPPPPPGPAANIPPAPPPATHAPAAQAPAAQAPAAQATAAQATAAQATASSSDQAVVLIRAMIAAANADGIIDDTERGRILNRLAVAQLSPEEQRFMAEELRQPRTAEEIAAAVEDADMARQVYLASLLAVEVDTLQERNYLKTLAGLLGLDAAVVTELQRTAAVEPGT